MSGTNYKTATKEEVLEWLLTERIQVKEFDSGEVHIYKQSLLNGKITYKLLSQRNNVRKRSDRGDPRVDIRFENKRKSIHVSHLVWMVNTQMCIPKDFEIHHRDENPRHNIFTNLLCVHKLDHLKLHADEVDDIPF